MELYKILRSLIKTLPDNKWVDKDYGQLDNSQGKPAVTYPCTLLKIRITTTVTISKGTQLCSGSVEITTAFDMAAIETSGAAPDAAVDRSLTYETYANAIYLLLQGYTGQGVTLFDRISGPIDQNRGDGLSVCKQVFNVEFLDTGAADLSE